MTWTEHPEEVHARPALRSALIDEVARDGTILSCDPDQASALGYDTTDLIGANWSLIYPISSRKLLTACLTRTNPGPVPEMLQLRDRTGTLHEVSAIIDLHQRSPGDRTGRIFKWFKADFIANTEKLTEDKEILEGIVAASDDPGWCIEFLEPVDLSAPEQEIIRQIFANRRRWRFCNAAMGRFYRLPEGMDLNDRPVDEIFPSSPENHEFAQKLIRANFDVARALSLDTRYDGTQQTVENDVRGLIRNNMLYRMWGTVRDVSQHHRRASELRRRIGDLETFLGAVPDALLLLDPSGTVIHANAIAQELFGLTAAQIEDYSYDRLVGPEAGTAALLTRIRDGATRSLRQTLTTRARCADGPAPVEINARRFSFNDVRCLSVSLRRLPAQSTALPGQPTQARP